MCCSTYRIVGRFIIDSRRVYNLGPALARISAATFIDSGPYVFARRPAFRMFLMRSAAIANTVFCFPCSLLTVSCGANTLIRLAYLRNSSFVGGNLYSSSDRLLSLLFFFFVTRVLLCFVFSLFAIVISLMYRTFVVVASNLWVSFALLNADLNASLPRR